MEKEFQEKLLKFMNLQVKIHESCANCLKIAIEKTKHGNPILAFFSLVDGESEVTNLRKELAELEKDIEIIRFFEDRIN